MLYKLTTTTTSTTTIIIICMSVLMKLHYRKC
uniref:Uncharacterized protein n=1 Tax=Anguilla anguilla TaxID=7936 RepID=A0A0E9VW57_ANGAN